MKHIYSSKPEKQKSKAVELTINKLHNRGQNCNFRGRRTRLPWARSPPTLLTAMTAPRIIPRTPKTRRAIARAISLMGGLLLTLYEVSIMMSSSEIENAWSTYAILRFYRILAPSILFLCNYKSGCGLEGTGNVRKKGGEARLDWGGGSCENGDFSRSDYSRKELTVGDDTVDNTPQQLKRKKGFWSGILMYI